jgi:hypothetical protein
LAWEALKHLSKREVQSVASICQPFGGKQLELTVTEVKITLKAASYNHQSTQLKFKGSGIRRQPFYQ